MATDSIYSLKVEGLKEAAKTFRSGPKWVKEELKAANKDIMIVVRDRARMEAPQRTGRLAKSVGGSASDQAARVKAGTGARVPYAGPIHFGWPTRPNHQKKWRGGPIAPNPFLYRAVGHSTDRIHAMYADAMDRLAKRISQEL